MSDQRVYDPHVAADVGALNLELVCEAIEQIPLGSDWRARLLASVSQQGRFERFVRDVAALLAVEDHLARTCLDALGDASRWKPGFLPQMSLFHLEQRAAETPAIVGFVRLGAGNHFPEHEHLGAESVLIIQGSCEDRGRILRPGDKLFMPAGSSHSFVVRPGPDLLYLAVVERGLRIGGREILAGVST